MPPDLDITQLDDEDCNGIQRFIRRFQVKVKNNSDEEVLLTAKVYFVIYASDQSTAYNPNIIDIVDENDDRIIPGDLEIGEIIQRQIRDAVIVKMKEAGMDENLTIARQYT